MLKTGLVAVNLYTGRSCFRMEFARAWDFGFHAGALTVRNGFGFGWFFKIAMIRRYQESLY